MITVTDLARFFVPWIASPLAVTSAVLVLLVYARGLLRAYRTGRPVSRARALGFVSGVVLAYTVMHTRFDYFAQYLFFMHRLQHLVLHHLAPFLIALSAPWPVLALGLPGSPRSRLGRFFQLPLVRRSYRWLQHPLVAPTLFVGLIYFWLLPDIHFSAMLNLTLYHMMNWSMLLDGILFWWLVLEPRWPAQGGLLGLGRRIMILGAVMPPQVVLGAYIALSHSELYSIYAVCGRPWPLSIELDQRLGGLITWIPAAMMSALGMVVVLTLLRRSEPEPAGVQATSA